MGIHRVIGAGRSLGPVLCPLSYLITRLGRWDEGDRSFFARSGEL